MGCILTKLGLIEPTSFSLNLLNENECNDLFTQIEENTERQNKIMKKQKNILNQLDIIIKHQKKHFERIKHIENKFNIYFEQMNDKIKDLDERKSLYKILNNIPENSIEFYCNKHQSKNSISWLPDNVEKNIYLNCLTFLKEIVTQDEKLLEDSVYENENFYSIKDSRTDIVWNNNLISINDTDNSNKT